jgi:hypothetical protein
MSAYYSGNSFLGSKFDGGKSTDQNSPCMLHMFKSNLDNYGLSTSRGVRTSALTVNVVHISLARAT